jgi:hypothetical protein
MSKEMFEVCLQQMLMTNKEGSVMHILSGHDYIHMTRYANYPISHFSED